MIVGVFDTCDDEISIFDDIEYATSCLMKIGISSTEVRATGLLTLKTVGCPPGFGVSLWDGVWFFSIHTENKFTTSQVHTTQKTTKMEDTKTKSKTLLFYKKYSHKRVPPGVPICLPVFLVNNNEFESL